MALRAGDLCHLVRLQKRAFIADGQGGFSKDWVDIDAIPSPAEVVMGGGAELLHAGQMEYTITYQVRLRYRADLTPTQRVIWLDIDSQRILDVISAINPDGRHIELRLLCTERVPVPGPIL